MSAGKDIYVSQTWPAFLMPFANSTGMLSFSLVISLCKQLVTFLDEKHPRIMLENVPCFTMDTFGVIEQWYDFEGEVIERVHFKNTFAFENRVHHLKELF